MDLNQIRNSCTHELASYPAIIAHPNSRLSCRLKSGLSFLPARNKKLSPRHPYRTGIYANLDANREYLEPVYGRGWHIDFRYMFGPIPEVDRLHFPRFLIPNFSYGKPEDYFVGCGPEAMIFARNPSIAKQLAHAINAAMLLVNGSSMLPIDEVAVARDEYYTGQYGCNEELDGLTASFATENIYYGIRIAKSIYADAALHRSLLRLYHSTRLAWFHPLDYSPSRPGLWPAIKAERDPLQFTAMALAIASAYSAIEELGLNVDLAGNPLVIDGQINAAARARIVRKVRDQGLDPERKVIWLRRGGVSLLEKRVPVGAVADRASWSKRYIRDHLIPLADAVAFCKWIRNKAGAHKTSSLTYALRPHDLTNVQSVVRDILLDSIECPLPLGKTRDILSDAIIED